MIWQTKRRARHSEELDTAWLARTQAPRPDGRPDPERRPTPPADGAYSQAGVPPPVWRDDDGRLHVVV